MNNGVNDEITRVAYELYVKSGRAEGNDLLNWLAAEKIVRFERMLLGKSNAWRSREAAHLKHPSHGVGAPGDRQTIPRRTRCRM